ncbi:hypothetical protein HOP51_15025 [Halomonas sp. MCCC 1A11036]|uniref:Lipoprotein n=1 Tax=Billgrantia zhangzhouensis TaxID=2733481 RepID=A0ABS9AIB7_9GAMM|nr:hypothetical protein [Halomonas zhangzhouensis]MCE8021412.1 hypothetical protein [Halomonas zhangzhouensis]
MEARHYAWMTLCAALVLTGCGDEQAAAPDDETALQDAVAYVGRWAAEPAWCAQGGEERAITLSPSRFEGYENTCKMEASQESEGTWTARLECSGEGMESSERIRMRLEDHKAMTLTWLDRDDAEVALMRCPLSE